MKRIWRVARVSLPCRTGQPSLTLPEVPAKLRVGSTAWRWGCPWTLLGVQKSFGKRVVLDLEGGDILILISGHRHKLCRSEGEGPHLLLLGHPGSRHTHHMDARLVLVQAVQHDLPDALRLVGQLHLSEGNRLSLPVSSKVWAVRVHVDRVGWGRLRLAPC